MTCVFEGERVPGAGERNFGLLAWSWGIVRSLGQGMKDTQTAETDSAEGDSAIEMVKR